MPESSNIKEVDMEENFQLKQNEIDITECTSTSKSFDDDKSVRQIFEEWEENNDNVEDDEKEAKALIGKKKKDEVKKLPKRVRDMYTTSDWWTLWIGLISFGLAVAITFGVPYTLEDQKMLKYVIPQPMKWSNNPLDAWDIYNIIGVALSLSFFGILYLVSLLCMGKIKPEKPISMYMKGFAGLSFIAIISFWLGRQEWCARNGFGYAIFSIVFGMIIANIPAISNNKEQLDWLKLAAKDGEFFIKCSLVLLAVEFSVISKFGLEAILVAWLGSPLVLITGYLIGTRLFKMEKGIALLVAVGSTWCGASAISATGAVIGASGSDMSLSISVVAFFTVIFTFVQAYIAIGVGMPHDVAGAWIGGSVDQTGNVIASAAIISDEAAEVAGIVKMVLNSGLGILATVISIWWQTTQNQDDDGKNDEESSKAGTITTRRKKKKINWLVIWDKFPKFVIGYILCSAILTTTIPQLEGTPEGAALQGAVLSLNKWWFAIAFVGIGIGTSVKDLWEGALKSGVLQLYLATNILDIIVALGLAYAVL